MSLKNKGCYTAYTSINSKSPVAYCGPQKSYWLELQFVDENNNPVSGLNVKLEYQPLKEHSNPTPPPHPPAGITNDQGLVRFEQLYWVTVSVKVNGQQLADEMEKRPLGVQRNPNSQPVSNNALHREMRDKNWRSDVQKKTEAAGYTHHYVTIGELCDQLPHIEGWDGPEPPEFHFPPERSLKGTEIGREELDLRHVIEICPFRAWVLALHDTKDYDLANGLNLGIMANLVYSTEVKNSTIANFFRHKCQDLSTIPQFAEYPSYFHSLAVDVPFRERYLDPVYLNTGQGIDPEGDTRLFTVECGAHVLVAWCGTDSLLNALTDASFGPKKCLPEQAGTGNVHGGFLEAYQLAKLKFDKEFKTVKNLLAIGSKRLFICGHSLGGALALLYAAEMKDAHPVLYTYGMPRTFTRSAVQFLHSVTHYRHINDNDTVPQVPLEADMDNLLYQKLGPLGTKLGFNWLAVSISGLSVSLWQKQLELQLGIQLKKDPYWHHGNTVIFLQAQQYVVHYRKQNMPWIGGGGRTNPAPGIVSYRIPTNAKLYLVPSLNDECLKATGEHQAKFIQCLESTELEKTFPKNTNPDLNGLPTNPLSHSMAHRYLPYIHNQLLELANPSLRMSRKEARERFRLVVKNGRGAGHCNQDEVQRNERFLALQNMLPAALSRTQAKETGRNALLRFAAVTEEEVE